MKKDNKKGLFRKVASWALIPLTTLAIAVAKPSFSYETNKPKQEQTQNLDNKTDNGYKKETLVVTDTGHYVIPDLTPSKEKDKRFSVGILYKLGQPAYTSLKADHETYNKTKRGIISNYKDLTNPGLLNMLGVEAGVKLTKNLNLTGSFSTSIGNEWKYNETYNDPTYKTIQRDEKAEILEGKLGLEGSIQAGNWSFSAGGGAVWNNVNFQSNHKTTLTDSNWIKKDITTSGNGWGYFAEAEVSYNFNKNLKVKAGISYENSNVGTSGNEIITNSQGWYSNDPKTMPFELERINLKTTFNFSF